jgi:hypothetical protein
MNIRVRIRTLPFGEADFQLGPGNREDEEGKAEVRETPVRYIEPRQTASSPYYVSLGPEGTQYLVPASTA